MPGASSNLPLSVSLSIYICPRALGRVYTHGVYPIGASSSGRRPCTRCSARTNVRSTVGTYKRRRRGP